MGLCPTHKSLAAGQIIDRWCAGLPKITGFHPHFGIKPPPQAPAHHSRTSPRSTRYQGSRTAGLSPFCFGHKALRRTQRGSSDGSEGPVAHDAFGVLPARHAGCRRGRRATSAFRIKEMLVASGAKCQPCCTHHALYTPCAQRSPEVAMSSHASSGTPKVASLFDHAVRGREGVCDEPPPCPAVAGRLQCASPRLQRLDGRHWGHSPKRFDEYAS